MFRVITVPYKVGDVVEQEAFGGLTRFILVSKKAARIKNGLPGFDGWIVDENGKPFSPGAGNYWGYDYQILRVVK